MNNKSWLKAKCIIEKIEQAGFEAVFVGGAVRDLFLGKESHDIDVATSALPKEVKSIFSKTVDVGIEHGTVLVLDAGEPIEVTTYRTEGTYSNFRRPSMVSFVRSLQEDLARRDFTINAMALTKSEKVIDLFNGQEDLQKREIRAVGNPMERFQEDALRMMRAVRLCAQLHFTIEGATLQAIQQLAPLLQHISKERIHAELEKIWLSSNPQVGMAMMEKTTLCEQLKGNFDSQKWTSFQANDPQVAWAFFYRTNNNDDSLFAYYKCSNEQKKFAKYIAEFAQKLLTQLDVFDLLEYDLRTIDVTYTIMEWLQEKPILSKIQLLEQKRVLPIQHRSQLAVNGQDLIDWSGKKAGPWLKDALQQALRVVLTNQIANENEHLKEWFNEFNER